MSGAQHNPVVFERRSGSKHMQEQLNTLSARVGTLEDMQAEQMQQTTRIENNTAELISAFNAFKGAWVVLNWIGKLAKPIAAIVSIGGGWYWAKDHIKDIFK